MREGSEVKCRIDLAQVMQTEETVYHILPALMFFMFLSFTLNGPQYLEHFGYKSEDL